MIRKMKILAIETSCDETGVALVEATGGLKAPRFAILETSLPRKSRSIAPSAAWSPILRNANI
jgi:tRNA A37 threonylcarbamoyltransferase TsaD